MTTIPTSNSVSIISAVRAFARRDILRTLASPIATIQSVVFPAALLMAMLAVFGKSVDQFSAVATARNMSYIQRLTPALVISGAAFGSLGAAVGLFADKSSGFFDRLRLTPFEGSDHQQAQRGLFALLFGRAISEYVRIIASTLILIAIGAAFGFRFAGGWLDAVFFLVLSAVFGGCFVWVGFGFATRAASAEAVVPAVNALFIIFLFLSYGMVPLEAFPGWVQPAVRFGPSSLMMRTLQDLAIGQPYLTSLLGALAWTAGITAVFGWLSYTGLVRPAKRSD